MESRSLIQISTKPPLSCGVISGGATEVAVDAVIETKVVFVVNRSSGRLERTSSVTAVDVKSVSIQILPELYFGTTTSCSPTNIYVLHWKALATTKIRHYVEVAEFTPHIISVINSLLKIETASCTPVCGLGFEAVHLSQHLAVHVPVWGEEVDGCILLKRFASKMRKIL